jgi:hypothetical protein
MASTACSALSIRFAPARDRSAELIHEQAESDGGAERPQLMASLCEEAAMIQPLARIMPMAGGTNPSLMMTSHGD